MFKQNSDYEILTPSGFQPFDGVNSTVHDDALVVTLDNGMSVNCSTNHPLIAGDGNVVVAGDVRVGQTVSTAYGTAQVVSVTRVFSGDAYYDPINVVGGNVYLSNGIVSHNCEFLSSDPTLIDPVVLANLSALTKDIKPVGRLGEVVFFKRPTSGATYLVGVDPSTGNGNDFTDFEVYEFPSMEQVAQFRSNTASSVISYHLLKKLLMYLERTGSAVYFSVENNGVGEGIIALYEDDETPPTGSEFLSEAGQGRKGMATTGKSKVKACLTLKEMIERNTIKFNSAATVQELKDFIRRGGTYGAKYGATDDSVMGTIIVMRLLEEIATFDQQAYDRVHSHAYNVGGYSEFDSYQDEYDGGDSPLGMLI